MFRLNSNFLLEIGYSISPLKVKSSFIKNSARGPFGEQLINIDIKESSGGSVSQILGGIRFLFPSTTNNRTYLRFGLSTYKRGNVTASFSGSYFDMDVEIHTEESGSNIYGGIGFMLLLSNKVGLDFQANSNLIFLED